MINEIERGEYRRELLRQAEQQRLAAFSACLPTLRQRTARLGHWLRARLTVPLTQQVAMPQMITACPPCCV